MGIDMNSLPRHVQRQICKKKAEDYAVQSMKVKAAVHPERMNKTEVNYAGHLKMKKLAGEIMDFAHEPFNLRLADRTFYKPDFIVITNDRHIEIHEVKGKWEDDALVKIKTAAEMHPWFTFRAVFHSAGVWRFRDFNSTKMGY